MYHFYLADCASFYTYFDKNYELLMITKKVILIIDQFPAENIATRRIR